MQVHNKDDIKFVTEFPCLLGHPVLKGTVSEISRDTTCKDDNNRFTTIPQKLCLVNFEWDINVYHFENWLFSIVDSLQKWLDLT